LPALRCLRGLATLEQLVRGRETREVTFGRRIERKCAAELGGIVIILDRHLVRHVAREMKADAPTRADDRSISNGLVSDDKRVCNGMRPISNGEERACSGDAKQNAVI